jgi:hypothetical protein
VYVADVFRNAVVKLDPDPEGKLELDQATPEIGQGTVSEPKGVAVDSTGSVYVTSSTGTVSKFASTGAGREVLIEGLNSPKALALDSTGNIYVATSSGTFEYGPSGACLNACAPINSDRGSGVAADAAGDIFVDDGPGNSVLEYGPGPEHPAIRNPGLESFPSFPEGLAINDTSHALYVVVRETETKEPAVLKVFRHFAARPVVVETGPATPMGGSLEALHGTVNPRGLEPAGYWFEYGTASCNTSAGTCGAVASEPRELPLNGDEAIPVSVRLDNLTPNTIYHYWIVGENEESGVEHGEEQTFTTGPAATTPVTKEELEAKLPANVPPAAVAEYPVLAGIAPVPGPTEGKPTVKRLTHAQQLQRALKACRRQHKKSKRKACERIVHKHFAPKHKAHSKKK